MPHESVESGAFLTDQAALCPYFYSSYFQRVMVSYILDKYVKMKVISFTEHRRDIRR